MEAGAVEAGLAEIGAVGTVPVTTGAVDVRVHEDVWVRVAEGHTGPPHPADARAAVGMPPWRAREFLAGRGVLRDLLAAVAPWARDAEVTPTGAGKPVLAGVPGVGVSVSHDGGAVAAAVALRRAVGVDLQRPPAELPAGVVRRCLRERAAELDRLPEAERAVEFARVWTVQEACVKAEGTGLAGLPWAIDVPARPVTGRWRHFRWVVLRDAVDVPLSCAFEEWTC
ncbi:4'-phosphopantetheinyl transferase family protein [Saccharothrix sp. NRRL B-16348]|uniref:4'-phosphopantetheinyl transferase family protein n=1 Tax=Saccharothrix sp. NRRL B-16348 TaxID=1415542 RepID=UPI000B224E2A|nr:4'-phosphopantetheinyl transferase superfamily protein [Saccharothrix sp. NRRL B-16348]